MIERTAAGPGLSFLWWRRLRGLVPAALALLVSCGGGVEGGGTGSALATYASGPITGFGSIVVNGVHYDESSASVLSDDGVALSAADLKLGMTVDIGSGAIDKTAGTAVAKTVQLRSDLLGPLAASDLSAGTLTVLGQTVQVSASTVFDDSLSGGQSALSSGQLLRVYAIYDPVSGVYAARRVEPVSSASRYRIRGQVSALDTSLQTFRIGTAIFHYGSAVPDLANGAIVRLQLLTSADSSGRWEVAGLDRAERKPDNGQEVELESVIASFSSLASFTVDGITVNAASAAVSPAGATVAAGVRVEVEGTMVSGVLVATKLEVKAAESGGGGADDGGSSGGSAQEFEVQGVITALDSSAKTLVVRGVTISYAGSVSYEGGTEANLALGAKVEVKGTLATGGSVVAATRIHFDS